MANQVTTLKMGQKFKKTPAGEIPVDWDLLPLGEVSRQSEERFIPNCHDDRPYVGLEHIGSGDGRLLTVGRSKSVSSLKAVFRKGDILFGKLRPNLKKIIVAPFDGVCSTDIIVIRPRNTVSGSFLFYRLQSADAFDFAISTSAGTKMPRTSWNLFKEYLLPCPPLVEQKKIAEILSSVDDVLETTQNELEAHQEFRRRLAHTLMSQSGKKWKQSHLRDLLIEPIRNGYSPICPSQPTGRWTLELGALSADGFRSDKAKPAPANDLKADSALLKRGDLLVSRSNTRNLVGLASIYDGQPTNCIFPDLMMRVCLSTTTMIPEFLETYLVSPFGRRYFKAHARGTSGSMVKINASILGDMPVPIPPLDEQATIVAGLRKTGNLIVVSKTKWNALSKLRQGLMRELLAGRKRVMP